jgi:hydrogenase-4 component F
VYSETPVPSTALLAAAVLNCALYGIIRFHILASNCLGPEFSSSLLIFFGLGSMVIAAPFVLVQRNFRRLLAYSSIDHTGIIVAALGFGGKLGALGAMLHMSFHAITKPLLFFCSGNVQQRFGSASFRGVQEGVIHRLPLTAVLFLLATLAVTGVPPFSIFQSEFTVLMAAFTSGRPWCAAIFVVCVVTIFSGFLFHMVRLNLSPKLATSAGTPEPDEAGEVRDSKTAAMVLVAIPVCVFGFWLPQSLLRLIEQAAEIIWVGT